MPVKMHSKIKIIARNKFKNLATPPKVTYVVVV